MRLWTLNPKYLDSKGLVALWREALLAQKVLNGKTRGYTHHPQLTRFKETCLPQGAIARYLQGVHTEATQRGYHFDETKIAVTGYDGTIVATRGQLEYEWAHLMYKLRDRSPSWFNGIHNISCHDPHPLFTIVPGTVSGWEITKSHRVSSDV